MFRVSREDIKRDIQITYIHTNNIFKHNMYIHK
jgi:hypothetical protein